MEPLRAYTIDFKEMQPDAYIRLFEEIIVWHYAVQRGAKQ
ncbi:MAG: hypothetical protein UZ08_BCD001002379 [Candidatus Parvibacillus calidus]|nr:MAG: hypothetical protein UZ08_BCD001002379 [Candidatus Parvibacillus calidus]